MEAYQREFIDFAIKTRVLRFGAFTLKSGRVSPYFFNAGLFNSGASLSELADYYAKAIVASGSQFDMLFGPAYKGIPLVSAAAIALYRDHGLDYPYAYNRKEAKDHGEGGKLVGAELKGRTLIIDDVITAGTAIREVMDILEPTPAVAAGVVVAIDRQERGKGKLSAIQEVEQEFGLKVISVIQLDNLITYLQEQTDFEQELAMIKQYRDDYGV